jgi:hypothetical protein
MIIRLAICLSLAFKEVAMPNWIVAMGTTKMVWMPHSAKGNHNWANDCFPALGTISLRNCVDSQFVALQHWITTRQLGGGTAAYATHFCVCFSANGNFGLLFSEVKDYLFIL